MPEHMSFAIADINSIQYEILSFYPASLFKQKPARHLAINLCMALAAEIRFQRLAKLLCCCCL